MDVLRTCSLALNTRVLSWYYWQSFELANLSWIVQHHAIICSRIFKQSAHYSCLWLQQQQDLEPCQTYSSILRCCMPLLYCCWLAVLVIRDSDGALAGAAKL